MGGIFCKSDHLEDTEFKVMVTSPSAKMNTIEAKMGCAVIDRKVEPLHTIKDSFDITVKTFPFRFTKCIAVLLVSILVGCILMG
jgi:hypothetical protein